MTDPISVNFVSKGAILPCNAVEFPQVIPSPGLSLTRQWYLFEQIRAFSSFESRDVTCPLPLEPLGQPMASSCVEQRKKCSAATQAAPPPKTSKSPGKHD